jgi:uncharacterized protein (DUF58 family)
MSQFSALILFLLAVAFLLRIDFIFYIIYVCVGVYAWSRWYAPRAVQKVSARRHFADHAFWGETVMINIRLKNRNRLPLPWIHLSESIAAELASGKIANRVLSLGSRETNDLTYHVRASRRGYYRLGPLRLTSGDLFGLVDEQQMELPADYITVYPRIIPMTQLGLSSRLPFGTIASRQRLFDDPARPMGVREFRSGDSLRQINWKVTAHTQSMVVKTLEPAIALESAVLLNLYTDAYRRQNRSTYMEWAIEVAASLAVHLVSRRQAVGLMTNGIDPLSYQPAATAEFDKSTGRMLMDEAADSVIPPAIPPRPGRAHLMEILERLARIEPANSIPFHHWTPGACSNLNWGVTILAVTAVGDDIVCQAMHRLTRSGYNPVLIVVEPDYNFEQVRKRARHLGFAAFNVTKRHDLDAGIGVIK